MSELGTQAALHLYRRLLRYGQKLQLTDQSYYLRRVKKEFKLNRQLTDPVQIEFNLKVQPYNFTSNKIFILRIFSKKGEALLTNHRII